MNRFYRSLRLSVRPVWRSRLLGLISEILFWARWISTRGSQWPEDFRQRLDPEKPLIDTAARYAGKVTSDPIRILDVGAGPITVLGYHLTNRNIEITAVDVLAKAYNRLLSLRGISPPVRTSYADAERLDERFSASSFDFVYSQNSIDHSSRPHVAVEQMIKAVKPGCHVVLRHNVDEAVREDYVGLHQWNFSEQDGDFIIWNENERFNMTRLLSPVGMVRTERQGDFITVDILKAGGQEGAQSSTPQIRGS